MVYGLTYPYGGEVKKMLADHGLPLESFTVVGRVVADRTIYNFFRDKL